MPKIRHWRWAPVQRTNPEVEGARKALAALESLDGGMSATQVGHMVDLLPDQVKAAVVAEDDARRDGTPLPERLNPDGSITDEYGVTHSDVRSYRDTKRCERTG